MPQRSNSARYLFGDRNPSTKVLGYATAGVAPHGSTSRWSYTVPADKKFVGAVSPQQMVRRTAGTAPDAAMTMTITPSGGGGVNTVRLTHLTNGVGDHIEMSSHPQLGLLAGDAIVCTTSDGTTGGTVDYNTGMQGYEYDQ